MKKLSLSYSSPPDRECLVGDIFVDNNQFAEIRYQNGKFELLTYLPDDEHWELPLEELIELLQEAKSSLESRLEISKIDSNPYSTEFSREDWHILKDAVIKSSKANIQGKYEIFDTLPHHLRGCNVANLIYKCVYLGHKKSARKAAEVLTNNTVNPWVILDKS